MSLNFVCAIVEVKRSFPFLPALGAQQVLTKLGFIVEKQFSKNVHLTNFGHNDEVYIGQVNNKWIVFGFMCARFFDENNNFHIIKNKISIHLISHSDNQKIYKFKHYEQGRVGGDRRLNASNNKVWARSYTNDELPIPNSLLNVCMNEFAISNNVALSLIQRIYSGMNGAGKHGIGLEPKKSTWVAAKYLSQRGDSESTNAVETSHTYQAMNPNSYKLKGKPWVYKSSEDNHHNNDSMNKDKSEVVFYSQADLYKTLHLDVIHKALACDLKAIENKLSKHMFNCYIVS